ncbi:UNVERIFIED_ORG: hypothetical protein GGE64_005213 [Rhizobium etli]
MLTTTCPASKPHHAVVGRDIVKEMADIMRAYPSCTYDDLRAEGFTARQIDNYRLPAKNLADRLATRRIA